MKRKRFKFKIGDVVGIRPDAELPDPPDDQYRSADQMVIGCVERMCCCPLYDLDPLFYLVSEDCLERI